MYNDRNSRSSHGRSNNRRDFGNPKTGFNRENRNRDFLTQKTPHVSEGRNERTFNKFGNNRSEDKKDNFSGNRSFGERSFSDRNPVNSGYNRKSSSSRFGSNNSYSSRRTFGQSRGRFGGNRNGRGVRGVAKQLDESLFIQAAKPIEEQAAYIPSFVFTDLAVNNILVENIKAKGFVDPTPIQDKTIPHILEGKDIVGVANTGTGKTGAFLIPLIEKVVKGRHNKILILVPTRELAEQIEEELFILTKNLRIYGVKCIGGDNIQRQIYALRRGYNFIIGTPGRVEDLIERKMLDLSTFKTIVLDEVDRMLDMGFVDEIKALIKMLPEDKQSLFFSATIDNKVEALMKTILKPDYIKVSVKTGVTSANIHQNVVYYSDSTEKFEKLQKTLSEYEGKKVLIFVNTKRGVDKIDSELFEANYSVTAIHGDKRQNWRKKSIDRFKSGRSNILVATDVAARGLDISGVALVVNYDVPNNHEDYIHRIGRTGRANQLGNALTFVQRKVNRGY